MSEEIDDLIEESQRLREELLKTSIRLGVFASVLSQEVARLENATSHTPDTENPDD